MGVGHLLAILWRRKLIVVVVAALVIGAAAYSLSGQPNIYESRAKVALLPEADNPALVPFYGQAVESLLPTYAELIESRSFMDDVADALPYETTGSALSVRAQPVGGLGVLDVVGSSEIPVQAQQVAQATAEAFVERLADNGIVTVTLLDDARLPEDPSSPKPRVVYAAAIILGLGLGALAALGFDRFFGRLNTVADLKALSGVGVLAVLPEVRRLRQRRVVIGQADLVELEEALRTLRTNVFFAGSDLGRGATIITGLSPADGKSTVAANLAVMTAEMGLSVLLIDGDIHRPSQHEIFSLSNDVGLSSVLSGASPASLAVPTPYPGLRVVTSGPPLVNRADELRLYLEMLPQFLGMADVVLIDSPPIRAADEVRLLAAFSARVVLLVRAGAVTSRQVQQAIDSLKMVGATLLGVVLARAKDRDSGESISYRDYRRPASEHADHGPGEGVRREAPSSAAQLGGTTRPLPEPPGARDYR